MINVHEKIVTYVKSGGLNGRFWLFLEFPCFSYIFLKDE